jgi:hypothetical protein
VSVDPRAFVLRDAYDFAAFEEPHATALVTTGPDGHAAVPAGGTVLVYGADGAGKTTLEADWSVHFAAGVPWLDLLEPTRPLTVALLENEGVRAEFRRKLRERLAAWDGPPLEGRLLVLEQPWGEVSLSDDMHRQELAYLINRHRVDLLFAGPLADLGVEGPGRPADVTAFGEQLALLRAACDQPLAIGVTHHENQSGQMSGAWGRWPDTVAHVQAQGHGALRIFWHKVRNASSLHKTTTKLVWADGGTFAIDERQPATEDRVREAVLAYVLANGGTAWGRVMEAVPGNDTQKRAVRDALLAQGVIFDAGGARGGMALWRPDDPAAPPRPRLDGVEDVVASDREDGEHDRPRPSVLHVGKDGVEDGRGRSSSSSDADEIERLAALARDAQRSFDDEDDW